MAITEGLDDDEFVSATDTVFNEVGDAKSSCLCDLLVLSKSTTGRFSLFALLSAFFLMEFRIEPLSRLIEPRSARGRVGVSIFGQGRGSSTETTGVIRMCR